MMTGIVDRSCPAQVLEHDFCRTASSITISEEQQTRRLYVQIVVVLDGFHDIIDTALRVVILDGGKMCQNL